MNLKYPFWLTKFSKFFKKLFTTALLFLVLDGGFNALFYGKMKFVNAMPQNGYAKLSFVMAVPVLFYFVVTAVLIFIVYPIVFFKVRNVKNSLRGKTEGSAVLKMVTMLFGSYNFPKIFLAVFHHEGKLKKLITFDPSLYSKVGKPVDIIYDSKNTDLICLNN